MLHRFSLNLSMKRLPFSGKAFQLKHVYRSAPFHCLLLLIWIAVGAGLRFAHLTAKPPWMDEVATVIFSLGNSSHSIPLDRVVALDDLLRPLQPNPQAGLGSVVQHLLAEDNHPPVYFMLAHEWMKLFPPENGVASVGAARSLPALLGVLAIPAAFILGWLVRSRLVAQLAAAIMAVSPYGIYLAQEARHYTLAILLVIASLCCLVLAAQAINNRRPLPVWVGLLWLLINNLGIAVHYFFAITLAAEALALAGLQLWCWRQKNWIQGWRLYAVGAGTLLGGLLWLPAWQSFSGSEQTSWLSMGEHRSFMEWINPIFQVMAGWLTMLMLLPVETKNLLVVIASALTMLVVLIWATPILSRGLKAQLQRPERLGTQTLGSFVLGAIALFFSITYVSGLDITRGSRYNFVYFPGMIVLAGASLAAIWSERQPDRRFSISGKQTVVLLWAIGFFSALTVVNNLGFAKFYRPEQLIPIIQQSQAPVLIAATVHKTQHPTVIGHDFLGVAWEIKRHFNLESPAPGWTAPPQFLLAQYSQNPQSAEATLVQALRQQPRPLDLWLVNFATEPELKDQRCFANTPARQQVSSYLYQHYHCPGTDQAG